MERKHKKKLIVIASVLAAAIISVGVFLLAVKPQIELCGDKHAAVEVFSPYAEQGAHAEYAFLDISDRIIITCRVNTDVPGDYTVVYEVDFFGRHVQTERTVSVQDTVPPVIELAGDSEMSVQDIKEFVDPGAFASDNYDGDISSSVVAEMSEKSDESGEKIYTVTYTVCDSAGNAAEAVRLVTAKDTQPPVIVLNGAKESTVLVGKSYSDPGAQATDNVTEKVEVTVSGKVDTSSAGIYTLTYSASDESGNTSSVTRTVRVRNPLLPSQGDADSTSGSVICLTFDDGPNWGSTDRILNILAEYNVKATFFVIDYSESKVPLIKRIVNEGHTLAIHSKSHDYSVCYSSADAYMDGLYYMQDKIYNDTGYVANIIRFPGGTSNTVSRKYCSGIMTELSKRVIDEGFNYVDWNTDSTDASASCRPKDSLVASTIANLVPGRTNVVLMHDAAGKKTTPEALAEIISYGADNGYVFARVTSATRCRHKANN